MRQDNRERGQVVILALIAMGIFLFGAIGLAIDGANLYLHRQMAQAAADSAAQAAMMSIFNHTNVHSPARQTDFTAVRGTSWNCNVAPDRRTPCEYALNNSFGATASDSVLVEFPDPSEVPGIGNLADDPVNLVRVTVSRNVGTTLMRLVGSTASIVRARAVAAILKEIAPVPILVTHPTLPESLKVQGTPTIQVCGGPGQSVQVNSSAGTPANPGLPAYSPGGNATIDLSRAGPDSDGTCLDTPTGADFGVFGGMTAAPPASQGDLVNFVRLGPDGDYLQPNSPIEDPLKDVPYPPRGDVGQILSISSPTHGCLDPKCAFYQPGYYSNGINVKNITAIFAPGIYYLDDGDPGTDIAFGNQANGVMMMCSDCDPYLFPAPGGGTVPGNGMLIYNVSPAGRDAQVFDVGANSRASLVGTPANSIYKSILFFQRREAPAPSLHPPREHRFGGGGGLSVVGTLYITNTREIMQATPSQYQPVLLQGNPGSATTITGEIIVSTLKLGGTGQITMILSPDFVYTIRKVALVR